MSVSLKQLAKSAAGAAAVLAASSAFATVITPTYTADQASFPGAPAVNTTGTSSGAVSTNFATNVPSANHGVLDQSFVNVTAGVLSQIAFYSSGTAGTTGNSIAIRLYQLGTPGTPASGGFQGGSASDTYIFPNASVALGTAGSNPDLLTAFAPVFDLSASGNNRYVTLDLTGAAIPLLANTSYAIEIDNGSATEIDARRAGATDFYTPGNIYGGSNTSASSVTALRGLPNSGGIRDGAFAVYTAVPEPSSLGLLGVAAIGMIRRRRASKIA